MSGTIRLFLPRREGHRAALAVRYHHAAMDYQPTLPADTLIDRLNEAYDRTQRLVEDLSDEQLDVPLMEIVNPFRWELGHVAFFYDVFLLNHLDSSPFMIDGAMDMYNSFTVDHDDRWGLPLPSRKETLSYMARVRDKVVARLVAVDPTPAETYCYLLAVMHEDMHAEAFTYMRQTLEYKAPSLEPAPAAMRAGIAEGGLDGDVEIGGGTFGLGSTPDLPFVFDNEKWAHPVEVAPFRIARAPVTNAEFAAFVDDDGYLKKKLWSAQGWVWRCKLGAMQPAYWCRSGEGWLRRHFDRMLPLEPNAPVSHVCWYEAEAFCNWAGRRLPTEAEWEVAASTEPDGNGGFSNTKRQYPWGDEPPSAAHANLDTHLLGCVDVASFAAGDSAWGCRQMIGNVWEWTASAYYPYPGFVVDTPYREYSAPWFGYCKVLRGGAWATRSRLATNAFRNFFRPNRSDIFAGFRTCAR